MIATITTTEGKVINIDLPKLNKNVPYIINAKEMKIEPAKEQITETQNSRNSSTFDEEQILLAFQKIYKQKIIPTDILKTLSVEEKRLVKIQLYQYFQNIIKITKTIPSDEVLNYPFNQIIEQIQSNKDNIQGSRKTM